MCGTLLLQLMSFVVMRFIAFPVFLLLLATIEALIVYVYNVPNGRLVDNFHILSRVINTVYSKVYFIKKF